MKPGKSCWGRNAQKERKSIWISKDLHTVLIWLSEKMKVPMQEAVSKAIEQFAKDYEVQ